MGFILKYLVFVSSISSGYAMVNNTSRPPSLPGRLDDASNIHRIVKKPLEMSTTRLEKQGRNLHSDLENDTIKNNKSHHKMGNPPSFAELSIAGGDPNDIEGFAVFVDSPDSDSDESNSDSSTEQGTYLVDDEDISVDDMSDYETSLKHEFSNKYKNGTVIHDIRIAVKHPHNRKVGKQREITNSSRLKDSVDDVSDNSSLSNQKTGLSHNSTSTASTHDVNSTEIVTVKYPTSMSMKTPLDENSTQMTSNNYTIKIVLNSQRSNSTEITSNDIAAVVKTTPKTKFDSAKPNNENSENCINRCLASCTVKNDSSSVDDEGRFDIGNESFGKVQISSNSSDEVDNTSMKTADQAGNTTVLSSSSSELQQSTTDAIPESSIQIGSNFKQNLIGTPEETRNVPLILNDICLTDTCVMKAGEFLQRMNSSADPCNNFYDFACGQFIKRELPDDYLSPSVNSEIGSDVIARMISVLREPSKSHDPIHLKEMKAFFGACVKSSINSIMNEVLRELGGWPAPHNPSWKIPSCTWQDIVFNLAYGTFVEYNFILLHLSENNETGKWILTLDAPFFVQLALYTKQYDILKSIEVETSLIASQLGADNETIVDSIGVLHLFMDYALSYGNSTQNNKTSALITLGKLKEVFPHLTLLKELPSLLEESVKINDDELIRVSDMEYLQKIDRLIRDTPVKTQTAILIMSAIRLFYNLVTITKDVTMSRYCAKLGWELYPQIMGNIYSTKFVDNATLDGVVEMLSQIKLRLEKTLQESSLSEENKMIAMEKLKSLSFIITNRHNRGLDRSGLHELVVGNSSFASMVKAGIRNFKHGVLSFLHQDCDTSLPYLVEAISGNTYNVNAFTAKTNVFIPFSIMHEKIYNKALPAYVNFAGIGIVIGHEIIHGILGQGGLLKNSSKFLAEEQCLIDQFSGVTERYLGVHVNGKITKDENLADLGGFREAYLAYVDWARLHRENEPKLPGLHGFNGRQMFWLTVASNWCQVSSRELMDLALRMDSHAPTENRINGQLSNLPEFSRDFHCPLNSPMNPQEKCTLW